MFSTCDICGAPGHTAKHCALRDLEMRKDPIGELQRQKDCRERERQRIARRNGSDVMMSSIQTSKGFGL